MSNTSKDFIKKAFEIANIVDPHLTAPNPRVGCVIVRDGKIITQGCHEKYGTPHAEQNAFSILPNDQRLKTKDLDIFITLEPCDHFHGKKTPSCTDLLIETKPKKIIVGSLDPHFRGKNIKKIKRAGIEVEVLNDGFHQKLNPFFEKHITTKKPYITLKVAQSLDGKIQVRRGENEELRIKNYELQIGNDSKAKSEKLTANSDLTYLTNKKSLEKVHQMRAKYSAILTTTQTILADNPQLNVRLENKPLTNPNIIIVGKSKLPNNLKIFQIPNRKILQFETFQGFWESEEVKKIDSIMTECGQTLNTYLLENNLVDEIDLFIAPKIIGNKNLSSFNHEIALKHFVLQETINLKGDCFLKFIKK